ncbi:MAG: hypothetical protein AAFX05_01515 [Planctomycetota bacterium]
MDAFSNDPESLIGLVAVGGGIVLSIIVMIGVFATAIVQTRSRQRTAREIAAYIAEGSMTPEQGESLLRAAGDKKAKRG